jgi:site-specific recombinase XerD
VPLYRACFSVIYAYGLRINEAVTLPVTAVDSQQMVLHVIGKRNKERVLPLTEPILLMLREVWNAHRSQRDECRHPRFPRNLKVKIHAHDCVTGGLCCARAS